MLLHHEASGEGPPLVVLHGLFGSSENWRTAGRLLGARRRVVAADLRNHGASPHAGRMDLPAMAEDVRELLDRLGLVQVDLLGHSLGGKVAMQLALAHPERVRRLVVVDIAPRAYPPHHRGILDGLLRLDLTAIRSRTDAEQRLAEAVPDLAVRRFLLKNLARVEGEGGATAGWRWKLDLPGIDRSYGRLNEALGGGPVPVPALFLASASSGYVTPADAPRIRELFPKAEIVMLPGVGHWIHAEVPELLATRVLQFLDR